MLVTDLNIEELAKILAAKVLNELKPFTMQLSESRNEQDRYISIRQAQEVLNLKRTAVISRIKSGKLTAIRENGSNRIRLSLNQVKSLLI